MTKFFALTAAALLATSSAYAGDADAGEKDFKRCKACHTISNGDEVIFKGGKTGPNLYGVVGRTAGTQADFTKYGDDLVAAGAAGLVWTQELLVDYVKDPKGFLSAQLDTSAKSKMSFKMKDGEDVAAYLASVGPAVVEMPADDAAPAE
ncbi:c-type cytochrome [Pacificibacter marinus]|uniref:Cytochrome c-551 n=1 Tax=Pacificibacter marinus TaxID=658057 RepID=A0A1Y5SJH4_9RHOB|nr:c-type cytochrome [Pacificibacter marinus]SEK63300.1 cytochrome c [Pacificibacter marinus]SLN40547.1 Cytochrome c-551 precursor [Pacificibacter marinus]